MNTLHIPLVERAYLFAKERHEKANQKRKYTDEPYINHPAAVVELVKTVTDEPEMLAAAWLHDTVEDTNTTIEEIEVVFGRRVANLVDGLTDVSRAEHGNREVRKKMDREHIAKCCPDTKTIKLADLIDNTRSIAQHDPNFARVYLKEKELLLEVLRDGHDALYQKALMTWMGARQVTYNRGDDE